MSAYTNLLDAGTKNFVQACFDNFLKSNTEF